MDLQNKVTIITGGSGGLGMAAAKAFSRQRREGGGV